MQAKNNYYKYILGWIWTWPEYDIARHLHLIKIARPFMSFEVAIIQQA